LLFPSLLWAGLTKQGYVDNFANIELLKPEKCPSGWIMTSWDKYQDGKIKVNSCSRNFSCAEGEKAQERSSYVNSERYYLRCISPQGEMI